MHLHVPISVLTTCLSFIADVDECRESNGGCEQRCVNFIGSYSCTCYHGYSLNADGRSCDLAGETVCVCGECACVCVRDRERDRERQRERDSPLPVYNRV